MVGKGFPEMTWMVKKVLSQRLGGFHRGTAQCAGRSQGSLAKCPYALCGMCVRLSETNILSFPLLGNPFSVPANSTEIYSAI